MKHLAIGALILILGLGTRPQIVAAQVERPRTERLEDACAKVRQVLIDGQEVASRDWAVRAASACGRAGGTALAAALEAHRRTAENTPALEQLVGTTALLRDKSIYNEALALAADKSASAAVRVQAIRVIYFQLNPGRLDSFGSFLPGGAVGSAVSSEGPALGEELPPDALSKAGQLSEFIAGDQSVPPAVRSAALKLARSVRVKTLCPPTISLQACADRLRQERLKKRQGSP